MPVFPNLTWATKFPNQIFIIPSNFIIFNTLIFNYIIVNAKIFFNVTKIIVA